ncbi:trans-aconitate 2-methyltransferase [Marinitenerispora sediminis]|uniref:Trans-aconitate 2-methyltransferase n=1 Tax=Marinitenerispora sediminis TaxID=1931232 RepID=A0A368T537_9ACTN|nr:trans-aconitate 2-methyltransferase [Marinitenerispora sediminis]RCV51412.1 trans-aconitate 2-methyltransferase [Marinitenerispora sediminis]RCV57227.1 trans-aconitate 2-methyltransferase [Marinitenerispora sediminis]RCV58580.1 trans-aconitate 2-methyltransferase [Marinitenerispora sediminis]
MTWDPDLYARYDSHRARPFLDLVSRVHADDPRTVVDLGCGTGALTESLARRWPRARVEGIDSSPEMVRRAVAPPDGTRLRVRLGDVREWRAAGTDVVVSNAALQWVPEHRGLLRRWAAELAPGAWLAWQVPGNFGAPSHVLLRDLAGSARWSRRLAGAPLGAGTVDDPAGYAALLLEAGCDADVWETTYLHRLEGPDPVLHWVRATALRPVLAVLGAEEARAFEAEYAALLRDAYPPGPHGTLFPFRRIFCVGRRG